MNDLLSAFPPSSITYTTSGGAQLVGDSRELLRAMPEGSVDLIVTSPPFALLRGEVSIQQRVGAHDPGELRALLRRDNARRSLRLSEARVLADLIGGRLDPRSYPTPTRSRWPGCATLASSTPTRTPPPATTCATAS